MATPSTDPFLGLRAPPQLDGYGLATTEAPFVVIIGGRQRRRRSYSPRILAISSPPSSSSPARTLLRRRGSPATDVPSIDPKSITALDELDLERGVCIPFRKYTPEGVCFLVFLLLVTPLYPLSVFVRMGIVLLNIQLHPHVQKREEIRGSLTTW